MYVKTKAVYKLANNPQWYICFLKWFKTLKKRKRFVYKQARFHYSITWSRLLFNEKVVVQRFVAPGSIVDGLWSLSVCVSVSPCVCVSVCLSVCVCVCVCTGENKADCDHCLDNPNRMCKHCSCSVCGDKREPDKQLMCDECDAAYHIYCLQPPLAAIPDVDEWSVCVYPQTC